jgi:hypothetical protein
MKYFLTFYRGLRFGVYADTKKRARKIAAAHFIVKPRDVEME